MSFLQKISNETSEPESLPLAESPPADDQGYQPVPLAPGQTQTHQAEQDTHPCPQCGSERLWRSGYGIHCGDCTPPKNPVFVVEWMGEKKTPFFESKSKTKKRRFFESPEAWRKNGVFLFPSETAFFGGRSLAVKIPGWTCEHCESNEHIFLESQSGHLERTCAHCIAGPTWGATEEELDQLTLTQGLGAMEETKDDQREETAISSESKTKEGLPSQDDSEGG